MDSNPFEVLNQRFDLLEATLEALKSNTKLGVKQLELIDRKELCKRLSLSTPTIMQWERKGTIPCIRIGESVRYNWPAVIEALENKTK